MRIASIPKQKKSQLKKFSLKTMLLWAMAACLAACVPKDEAPQSETRAGAASTGVAPVQPPPTPPAAGSEPLSSPVQTGGAALAQPGAVRAASDPSAARSRPTAARYALEGICEVKPAALVSIKSHANGEVVALNVDVGDRVRKGQLLLEISPRTLQEQTQRVVLAQERVMGRRELLQLQIASQKREVSLQEALYSEAGMARLRLGVRERETELESLKIELRELALRQRELERELRYTKLNSPKDGVIVKRSVELGQIVNAAGGGSVGGDALLELADTKELVLNCAVHAEDIDLIEQRLPLELEISRANRLKAPVEVRRIDPMIDATNAVQQLRFTAAFLGAAPDQARLGARYPIALRKMP